MANVSQVGILILSLSAEAKFLNERGFALLSLSVDEAEELEWMKSFHPDDKETFLIGLLAAMEADLPFEAEHRILQKQGGCRWILTLAVASKNAQGETTSYVDTMTDITELKEQQEDLRRLNHALKTLSKCNEIVALADSEEQLLKDVCQAIESVGGYSLVWKDFVKTRSGKSSARQKNELVTHNGISAIRLCDYPQCCNSLEGNSDTAVQILEPDLRQCVSLNFLPHPNGKDGSHNELIIFNKNTGRLTEHEVSILEELAADVSFGILNLKLREERNLAQKDSLEFQKKLRQSLEDALQALAATTEKRDPYTSGHQ